MPLITLVAGNTATASDVNTNFGLCVLEDTSTTITVTHTWTASQTFTGGFTSASTGTLTGLTFTLDLKSVTAFATPSALSATQCTVFASTFTIDGKCYTTDATVTTVKTVTIPVSTTLVVAGYIAARRTGGAAGTAQDGAGYRLEFVAKNTAGTAALIAAATKTVLAESQAGWDVSATASGGTVLVQVTGAVDNNVTWYWTGQTLGVSA